MIVIERVELSKNPVQVKEQFKVSVTIVTHNFLSHSTHNQLKAYHHRELRTRGTSD